jgi:hypothetical protein
VGGDEEAGHAVVAGTPVDVAEVVVPLEGTPRLGQQGRPPGQVLVEQPLPGAACTLAVSVSTPSVSNTTASRPSRDTTVRLGAAIGCLLVIFVASPLGPR